MTNGTAINVATIRGGRIEPAVSRAECDSIPIHSHADKTLQKLGPRCSA